MPDMLTAEQLAKRLAVKPSTIRKWAREGRIPELTITPKVRRFDAEAVMVELKRRGVQS